MKWSRLLYQPSLPLYGDTRITGSRKHIELSRKAAGEGIVLLKNSGLLPLDRTRPLALFGKASVEYIKGGGGSGDVHCAYTHSLYDGLEAHGTPVFLPLKDFYHLELEKQYADGFVPGMTAEPELPGDLLEEALKFTDTALIVINRFSGEGWDRSEIECREAFSPWPEETSMPELSGKTFPKGDFYLTEEEAALVRLVTKRFPHTAVLLNIAGMTDLGWIAGDERIEAALLIGQGGMEGGDAAADVLLGDVCPSGHLSDTFAYTLEDYPSTEGFQDFFDHVDYQEDIYVGYRYFETIPGAAKRVVYPFGYGLSYTSFSIEVMKASVPGASKPQKDSRFCFPVRVTNTGKRAGKEVVQLYVKAPSGKLGKAARVLCGFRKTRLLEPGESEILELETGLYELASYDDEGLVSDACYVLEKGEYRFYIGSNVRDAKELPFSWNLTGDFVFSALSHKLVPSELKRRMRSDGSFREQAVSGHKDINASLFPRMEPGTDEGILPEVRRIPPHYISEPLRKGARMFREVADGTLGMDEFLEQLDEDDLIWLLGGRANTGVANVFGFGGLPEYGVPAAMTADGPAGIRIAPETGIRTTAFPAAATLACSWNTELSEEVGSAGAEELKENNLCLWLTPAVNIHRNPLCGRNFEYYSEDPFLAGHMAAALVRGIQRLHVGAAVKHFACNNKETNRKHSDSRVSERALREIYLKVFEIVVKEADPYAVMSSYNAINGVRTSEDRELLTGILREEWGYEGMVTTDWWNRSEQYREILAGNDLKMGCGFPDRVCRAMELGTLERKDLEACARRILKTLLKFD